MASIGINNQRHFDLTSEEIMTALRSAFLAGAESPFELMEQEAIMLSRCLSFSSKKTSIQKSTLYDSKANGTLLVCPFCMGTNTMNIFKNDDSAKNIILQCRMCGRCEGYDSLNKISI